MLERTNSPEDPASSSWISDPFLTRDEDRSTLKKCQQVYFHQKQQHYPITISNLSETCRLSSRNTLENGSSCETSRLRVSRVV
jgi:hypothetical protein